MVLAIVLTACQQATPTIVPSSPPPVKTTAAPATATILPTPNPLTSTVTQWSSPSPDGQFVARGIFSTPLDGSSNGATFANVSVGVPNGRLYWTLVNDWLLPGLGAFTPQPVQWSKGSKVFYYTNLQSFDGCKVLRSNGSDLWSVDMDSGKITQLLPMQASYIALSPDETRLAYIEQGSLNLVFRNLKTARPSKRSALIPTFPSMRATFSGRLKGTCW